MSRMTNFDVTARPAGTPAPVSPYYDPVVDALTAATASLWTLDWERQADGTFAGFGEADLFGGRDADLAARIAEAVRTVLPGAAVRVRAIDLDNAPSQDYDFGAGS